MKKESLVTDQKVINGKQVNFKCQHVEGETPETATAVATLELPSEANGQVRSSISVIKNVKKGTFNINAVSVKSADAISKLAPGMITELDAFIKKL